MVNYEARQNVALIIVGSSYIDSLDPMTPNIVMNSSQPEIHDFQIWRGLTTNYACT